jgi:molecular chaperone GrpE
MSEQHNRRGQTDSDQPDADDGTGDHTASMIMEGEELEQLRAKASERDQYLDLLQRSRAEFENYQKRNQKDREQERRYMYGALVLDLLPILDNLERTLAAANQAGEAGSLVQGVAMVHGQFLELLKRYGVTPLEALGQPFDPHLHQALMQREVPDQPPNTVVDVVEQGYMNQDRVLRPAKVVVSKRSEE